jgi:hypothetical protein
MTDKRQDEIRDNKTEKHSTQPDPETLHTQDPQENMRGPVSSPTHNTGTAFDTNETKEEAEEVRDRNV